MTLNIVIPMAGAGSRFAEKGYTEPKPLIPISGVPMIELVVHNLRPTQAHRFIFICQKAHISAYGLQEKLHAYAPDCAIIGIEGITEGSACTVLKAKALIDTNAPLMIANSDQYVDCAIDDYLAYGQDNALAGWIMTMRAQDPKWSYAGLAQDGFVERVVEKEVISHEATVGIYNFAQGRDFVRAAETMIDKNMRSQGEFYVAPVYNLLLAEKTRKIGVYNIGADGAGMYGLGTPDDLEAFCKHTICAKAVQGL